MTTHGGNWKDLLKACGEGDIPLVHYHLRQGVDPNFQHAEYFTCPIFEAIRNGRFEVVKILMEQGKADPGIIEELTDQTTIEVAVEAGQWAMVDYLNDKMPINQRHKFRNILVTEGHQGVGKAICEALLRKGHRLVFICPTSDAGDLTTKELKEATKNEKVSYIIGDFSSIQSVNRLAYSIQKNFESVDVLIHNARVWPIAKEINDDGLERAFFVNYMGMHILTNQLGLMLEKNGPDSRIIFFTDKIYAKGNADIQKTPFGKDFHRFRTYMHMEQCRVILFLNTARRFQNTHVRVNAVNSDAGGVEITPSGNYGCCTSLLLRLLYPTSKEPGEVVVGPVWLAESSEAGDSHGKLYDALRPHQISDSVKNPTILNDWGQWTVDFLAANEGKQ